MLNPKFHEAHFRRARAELAIGDTASAFQDLSNAIRINDRDANYLTIRGFLFLTKGDLKNATKDLNKAIKLDPDFDKPYLYRAKIRIAEDQLKPACADLHSAANLDNLEAKELIEVYCFDPLEETAQ
jgi:serine protease Do